MAVSSTEQRGTLREVKGDDAGRMENKKSPCNRWVNDPKKVKLADKPGSVVDSHSSRRFVT